MSEGEFAPWIEGLMRAEEHDRRFNPTRQDTDVLFIRTYTDMLKFFDGNRGDLEVRYHIKKHLFFIRSSRKYERYCILKAIRYNQSVRR